MKRHILIIADGRSPTARSWIRNIQSIGYEVSLISSFACEPPPGLKQYHHLPIAFSQYSTGSGNGKKVEPAKGLRGFIKRFSSLFQYFRYWIGPISLSRTAPTYQYEVREINPDLIHALRIPFEGMLASYSPEDYPVIISTWGNDLTLHAKGSPFMRSFTRRCLNRADGLTSDTYRDVNLAAQWGLDKKAPTLVVPGSGGIDLENIQNAAGFSFNDYNIPENKPIVVNPRGIRPGSVHQDVFFAAIPQILKKFPGCSFVCPGLESASQAHEWVTRYLIEQNTFLLPNLPQSELWGLFKISQIFVSPSSHDGTPNSLLESMACGCYPVVGDIESLREWVKNGKNGSLINPRDPDDLAKAIINTLNNPSLRESARQINISIIQDRAAQNTTRPKIDKFFSQFFE